MGGWSVRAAGVRNLERLDNGEVRVILLACLRGGRPAGTAAVQPPTHHPRPGTHVSNLGGAVARQQHVGRLRRVRWVVNMEAGISTARLPGRGWPEWAPGGVANHPPPLCPPPGTPPAHLDVQVDDAARVKVDQRSRHIQRRLLAAPVPGHGARLQVGSQVAALHGPRAARRAEGGARRRQAAHAAAPAHPPTAGFSWQALTSIYSVTSSARSSLKHAPCGGRQAQAGPAGHGAASPTLPLLQLQAGRPCHCSLQGPRAG